MRAPKATVANARRLRRNLSPPEARLWSRLRARAPGALIFRRQHPIGPYVIDFYCAPARLAVEVDGIGHDMGDRPQRDLRRDAWLSAQGVTVMRIAASEVMRAFDDVVDAIARTATARIEAKAPSTALRAVPLPRCAEEEGASRRRREDTDARAKERS
jgi:very-short-patch-repair endonuclease